MKKLIIILSLFVIVTFIFSTHKKIETNNKNFNVYIKEGNSYVKQNTSSFPTSGYTLNTTESTCTGGGTLSQSPSGKINLSMSSSEKCDLYFDPNAAGTIMNIVGDADPTSTSVITKTAPSGATCTNTLAYDGTTDNNLRYVGANPCNYVTFNGEVPALETTWVGMYDGESLEEFNTEGECTAVYNNDAYCEENTSYNGWRIVGVMTGVDDGTGKIETRIKLVRARPLGQYSWDSSSSGVNSGRGVNDWTQADLMTELNGDFLDTTLSANTYWYNGQNNQKTGVYDYTKGLSNAAQAQLGNAKWYLGGMESNQSDTITNTMYTLERGTKVWGNPSGTCNDGACPRATVWIGKVALIYPSDYGYATAGGGTTNRNSCIGTINTNTWHNSSYSDCKNNDWLKPSYFTHRLLSPYSPSADISYNLNNMGHIFTNSIYNSSLIFPAVYLKANVKITGGDGSPENPYTLG